MDFTIVAAIVAVIMATAYFVQVWTDRRARTPARISQKTMRHIRLQHHMQPSTDTQLPSNVADSTTEKTRAEQKIAAKPRRKDGDPSEQKPREKNIVHVSVDTSTPPIAPVLARPISSLDDLLSWLPGFDSACVPRVALQRRAHADIHPKLIVCHDMMGGYVSDAYVQGCYPVSDVQYYISHWEMISAFIYFSHHFVTVPPPGWTNCAHKHGVPVLGTIITEWEEGAKICERFLESEWTYRRVVDQLVGVALYYKLDGWLVNIENPIRRNLVSTMRDFVAYLTERMNASIPHSEVIWYDSVTTSGSLKWQNELNDQNSMFFTACNGIFLNYTWTDWTLRNTASRAGPRKSQVYVGIDVFGRGCPGGGGFNSKEALEQIYSHDLSAALFAPGWVYENNDKSKFVQFQEKFWNLLKPHCKHCYGYGELPFVTCFSRGVGSHLSLDGQVSLSNGWFNLSVQDPQPTWLNNCYSLDPDNSSISIHSANLTTEDSYSGGHSLSIEGKVKATEKPCRAIARLFSCDFDVTSPLLISYSYKQNDSISNRLDFSLVLHIDCPPTYLALTGNDTENNKDEDSSDKRLDEKLVERYGIARSKTVDATRFRGGNLGSQHYEAYAPLEKCDIIGEEPKNNGWTTRHYLIAGKHLRRYKIREIRAVLVSKPKSQFEGEETKSFAFKLGYLRIASAAALKASRTPVTQLRCSDVAWTSTPDQQRLCVSLLLTWDYTASPAQEESAYYDVYGDETFIGRAFTESHRVLQLPVAQGEGERGKISFTIQTITRSGFKLPLSKSTSLTVEWTKN